MFRKSISECLKEFETNESVFTDKEDYEKEYAKWEKEFKKAKDNYEKAKKEYNDVISSDADSTYYAIVEKLRKFKNKLFKKYMDDFKKASKEEQVKMNDKMQAEMSDYMKKLDYNKYKEAYEKNKKEFDKALDKMSKAQSKLSDLEFGKPMLMRGF